jgi:cyclophilin family peptidyl-prolyl cis-trans isomerase
MQKIILFFSILLSIVCNIQAYGQSTKKVRKADLKRDVLMKTDLGNMVLRLSDSTPIHRNNFIQLIRSKYYEGINFHRVIAGFMIQAGNESTKKNADTSKFLTEYTLPAEINNTLFHRKGVLAAARMGDSVNPSKASSGVQFYIVQGRVFNNSSLDSVQTHRLKGRQLPEAHRTIYKTVGGAPHLDQNYTIFGELIEGYDVLDLIANVKTTGMGKGDRPLKDVKITGTKMIKRRG